MAETVEARAVKIAAKCLVSAGACRFEDSSKCRKDDPNEFECRICIQRWLLNKARKELGSK